MSINLSEKKSIYTEKMDELTIVLQEIKTIANQLVNSKDFNIEITKKISESETKLAVMAKDIERLDKDLYKLEDSIKDLDEQCKELTGSINQIRLSLSDLLSNSEKQSETKKKASEIIWQILIPIIGAGLLFFLGVSLRSCTKIFQPEKPEVTEYKTFENK